MAEYDRNALLSRMLSEVPADIDKREGSVIYNTLAPVATALGETYFMLAHMMNLMYSDTAEQNWLDRVTSDFGIDRETATNAVRQINTYNSEGDLETVPVGSRFAIEDTTFVLTEHINTGQYRAACEQAGVRGNLYSGPILPVDHINGLGSAQLVAEPLIPARDTEPDDSLRARFYTQVRQVAYGGNVADYEQKTLSIDGVGAVRVFSALQMGAGNVGIIIADEQGNTATQALIDEVQALMGEDGDGIAPIGHAVTVGTSVDLSIDVSAQVRLKAGTSFEIVRPFVVEAIENYINSIAFTAQTVFYAKLVADILNSHESILDVGTVTLNGGSANIALTKTFATYQLPVVGTVTVVEVS